ncbi:hypothetical protein B0181_04650 [Moraxella caviae]|uniref:Uncharacterized protein n=1 Tax=Moraxella caviae TaxID=34060 RepID=A0A1T0A458_9GAMM|nr:hypothetical protein [Moraxella caviae]OOR90573.1 hypothetical protein B0181_04650 [Moraxella caviae]STZ13510.1 Uncharacterised protein [Moraxella caviae]STZ13621.1 Uncharacterised protein [Moraxella caviae]STZ13715.1 Uncharacterised protein [Moraxella caviae]VEW12206.1 Uncharacterised protein [Moraxella caviae]
MQLTRPSFQELKTLNEKAKKAALSAVKRNIEHKFSEAVLASVMKCETDCHISSNFAIGLSEADVMQVVKDFKRSLPHHYKFIGHAIKFTPVNGELLLKFGIILDRERLKQNARLNQMAKVTG